MLNIGWHLNLNQVMNKKLDYELVPHPQYGFLQVSPTPSDEEITQFYANEFYSGDYKNFNNCKKLFFWRVRIFMNK